MAYQYAALIIFLWREPQRSEPVIYLSLIFFGELGLASHQGHFNLHIFLRKHAPKSASRLIGEKVNAVSVCCSGVDVPLPF